MDAYIYCADMFCHNCAEGIKKDLDAQIVCVDSVPDFGDSDSYPQGPYQDGGGESDTPQHCGSCGLFLENPLTDEGYKYVADHALENSFWTDFYRVVTCLHCDQFWIEGELDPEYAKACGFTCPICGGTEFSPVHGEGEEE